VLWGFTLQLCFGLVLIYEGDGLAIAWVIIAAVLIYHVRETKTLIRRNEDEENDAYL
jgi:hypothetical protein